MVRCNSHAGLLFSSVTLLSFFFLFSSSSAAPAGRDALLVQQGERYIAQKAYTEAADAFKQALRLNPSAEAYAGLGLAYLKLGANEVMTNTDLLEKGIDALHAALRLKPDLIEVHRDLGLAALAVGNRDEALREKAYLQKVAPTLAGELDAAIAGQRPRPSYREIGTRSDPESGNTTSVAIEHNAVMVPVSLCAGGQTTQAVLILDTGASVTTISPEIAARLGLRLDEAPVGKVQVVGGGMVEARAVKLDRISVGPRSKSNMIVAVIGNKGPYMQFDGLLGMDFLREFRYHVDFRNRVINWAP